MKIALFIPCYIDALYPQVGEASYRLLRSLGLDVDYPLDQTCCGQPMANAGYERDAQPLAERMEELFAGYDYVVGPSASCVSFVREGYPRLVPHADGRPCLASRIYEICEFVHDEVRPERLDASFHHKVSIHNSCHGVRLMGLSTPSELNIPYRSKLRDLLALLRKQAPRRPQTVLLSATLSPALEQLATLSLQEPSFLDVDKLRREKEGDDEKKEESNENDEKSERRIVRMIDRGNGDRSHLPGAEAAATILRAG